MLEVEGINTKRRTIFDENGAGDTDTNRRYDSQVYIMNGYVSFTVHASRTGISWVS